MSKPLLGCPDENGPLVWIGRKRIGLFWHPLEPRACILGFHERTEW